MSAKNERIVDESVNGANAGSEGSAVEHNKAIMRRFQEEVLDGHNWQVETLAKYLTPDYVDRTAGPEAEPGLEGVSHRLDRWHTAFGDAVRENHAVLGEGDMMAVLYDTHASHQGGFMGIAPSHREVVIPGIEILRFRGDKIAESWSIYDYLSTAVEIGAMIAFELLTGEPADDDAPDQDVYRGIVYTDRKRSGDVGAGLVGQAARNKAALLGFQREVFNGHDWRVETLAKHLTPDFIDHAAGPDDIPGLEGVQSRFTVWNAAFDDADEENMAMVGQGDMLAVLYDLHAWHRGEFLGIEATNKEVVIPGIEMLRFRDGMIAEHWGIYDFQSTAAQLGAKLTFMPMIPVSPAITEEEGAPTEGTKKSARSSDAAAD